MGQKGNTTFVEIVAKKKGCILCDLALGILEEIAPDFEDGMLKWDVVDVGTREGLQRLEELTKICGQKEVKNGKLCVYAKQKRH